MNDEPIDTKRQDLAADKEAALAIPATYIDTWFLTSWRGHVRIALGEQASEEDRPEYYRAAFVLELRDAEKFAMQVLEMVQIRKTKQAETTKKPESAEQD